MKGYYDKKYKSTKSKSYLFLGLTMSAIALVMIVMSVLAIVNGSAAGVIVSGFAAGAVWASASGISLYVYYRNNRIELKERAAKIAESVAESVESVKSVENFLRK